uniref:Tomoregulin-1 n=1 Tax=Anas zonorhyncha TaxID=75864 RepID=A0A8B9UWT7_9AVES
MPRGCARDPCRSSEGAAGGWLGSPRPTKAPARQSPCPAGELISSDAPGFVQTLPGRAGLPNAQSPAPAPAAPPGAAAVRSPSPSPRGPSGGTEPPAGAGGGGCRHVCSFLPLLLLLLLLPLRGGGSSRQGSAPFVAAGGAAQRSAAGARRGGGGGGGGGGRGGRGGGGSSSSTRGGEGGAPCSLRPSRASPAGCRRRRGAGGEPAAAEAPCGRLGGDAEGVPGAGGERTEPPGRRRGLRLMLRACRRHPAAPRPPLAMVASSPAAARPRPPPRGGPPGRGRGGPPLALCYTSALLLLALSALPAGRASHPLPAAECQGGGKGKGINCSELNVRESDVRVCDESSCKYGGVCKEEGDGLKCACQFQCHTNYIPVCGSNGDTYQNECFLRRAACKHQKEITVVSRGPCYSDNGSGSGEGEYEGSGTEVQRKHSKCGVCKYRAECDEDAENVGCVCNIDCSGYSFNPVCASDGSSYNNPCFVREASCLRQEQIDIRHLGHCSEADDTNAVGKKDDGMQYRPEVKDASDQREDIYVGNHIPCSESFNGYCIHGKCEFIYSTQKASCRCESGYTGQHCEKTDFSILYVVPSRQKLTHVLIAAIIGAVQIAIIVAIVMCITRKCPKNNRGRRQKQNLGHFTSDTSSRMV